MGSPVQHPAATPVNGWPVCAPYGVLPAATPNTKDGGHWTRLKQGCSKPTSYYVVVLLLSRGIDRLVLGICDHVPVEEASQSSRSRESLGSRQALKAARPASVPGKEREISVCDMPRQFARNPQPGGPSAADGNNKRYTQPPQASCVRFFDRPILQLCHS